jgi:hypothetical protein
MISTSLDVLDTEWTSPTGVTMTTPRKRRGRETVDGYPQIASQQWQDARVIDFGGGNTTHKVAWITAVAFEEKG